VDLSSQIMYAGVCWCRQHPDLLFLAHQNGHTFIAIHPSHGIVITATDIEDFQARLNDRRPSILRQLYLTCTNFWVHFVQE
jgi:hypothetical protein